MHRFTNIDDWQYLKAKRYIFCILYVRCNQVHITQYCLKIKHDVSFDFDENFDFMYLVMYIYIIHIFKRSFITSWFKTLWACFRSNAPDISNDTEILYRNF